MKKILFLAFALPCYLLANEQQYTISVCTTSNLENALVCKKRIFDNMRGEVFIIKQNNKYFTNLNIYKDKEIAKVTIKNSSKYVKDQKPYIKDIEKNIVNMIDKRKLFIDMDSEYKKSVKEEFILKKQNIEQTNEQINEEIKEDIKPKVQAVNIPLLSMVSEDLEILGSLPYDINNEENKNQTKTLETNNQNDKEDLSLKSSIDFGNFQEKDNLSQDDEEELLQVSLNEFDEQNKKELQKQQIIKKSYEKKVAKPLATKDNIKNIMSYDEIIIKVDSKTNIMELFVKNGQNEKKLKSYIVSTGKHSVKKPFGEGRISQISLNPTWYPTADSKRSFAKKGIALPDVVPPNHKYNYMGQAKLNLTHAVDGNTTYRIHGTLNEKTLGSNESAGCIRMKNSDVVELAKLVEEFAEIKSLNKVRVILI